MPMYNLIEYSDNYEDSSATLYQYKRDEPPDDIANNLTQNNSTSFDYKIKLLGNPEVNNKKEWKKEWKHGKKNVYYQINLVMLYLLLMIQSYMFQLLLCQKKIIKILLNNKIKVFNDLFIGMNIKQKNE